MYMHTRVNPSSSVIKYCGKNARSIMMVMLSLEFNDDIHKSGIELSVALLVSCWFCQDVISLS